MEKYYKVRESVLLSLLEESNRLNALQRGGVDNWMWCGDSYLDYLQEYCEENGIDPEQVGDGRFGFTDLVEIDLKTFEEIKEEE